MKSLICPVCKKHFSTRKDKVGRTCSRECLYISYEKKHKYKNKLLTISELSGLSGLSKDTIRNRIKRGWDINKIMRRKQGERHGLTNHRLYWIHHGMKQRCSNKNAVAYKNYGGRGISYCPEWETFINFYNDMNTGYADGLTLERIDNDGNYCKENCMWATRMEQSKNKRVRKNAHWLEYKGCKRTIKEWSKITGIKHHTIYARIFCYNWSVKKALNET